MNTIVEEGGVRATTPWGASLASKMSDIDRR